MQIEYFIIPGCVAILLFGLAWRSAASAERKEHHKHERKNTGVEERIHNYQPQTYQSIEQVPHHPCGRGPEIPKKLAAGDSLVSDFSALTSWHIIMNGEIVHDGITSALEMMTGKAVRCLTDVETVARRYPQQEWLARRIEPLRSLVYQRHQDGEWNLVRVGPGLF